MLTASVRVLAAIGGLAMISTGECQAVFSGVFAFFFLIGLRIERFPGLARVMAVIQPFLGALVFIVALVDFFYLSNSFLLSVAHFLLLLQGLRVLVLRTNRECLGGVLVASLMILSASTLAMDWTYFLMLFLFLIAVIWTLILYTVLEESRANAPSGPALRENTLAWRQMMPVLRWSVMAAFALSAGCCAVVFLAFPRFNFQGFRGQFLQPIHKAGFTSQVDVGKAGKVFTDESVVMRVVVKPQDRDLWTGYMRGQALEVYDGAVWRNSQEPAQRIFVQAGGQVSVQSRDEVPGELLHQSVYLESMDSPLLFAAPRAAHFQIQRPFVDALADGGVQRGNGDSWRIHYEVDSYASQLDPHHVGPRKRSRAKKWVDPNEAWNNRATEIQKIVDAGAKGKNRTEDTLAIPEGQFADLRNLAASIVKRAATDAEKVARVAAYLRKNYAYSLAPGRPARGENPVDRFLFKTKAGHCEYFASAMCLLLRTQGVRTRMATGFLSREWNGRGGYYVVRMKHAHAWVEAFVAPDGWVGFDPSPRDASDGFRGSETMRRFSESMDYLNLRWNRYILNYDFERQVQIVKMVSLQGNRMSLRLERVSALSGKWMAALLSKISPLKSAFHAGSPELTRVPRFAGAFVLALIAAAAGWLVWTFTRRRERVWFYPKLVRFLEKKTGEKIAGRTLREFFDVARSRLGEKAAAVDFLQANYYRLRFDPSSRLTPQENQRIKSAVSNLH